MDGKHVCWVVVVVIEEKNENGFGLLAGLAGHGVDNGCKDEKNTNQWKLS